MLCHVQVLRSDGRLLARDELAQRPVRFGRMLTHTEPARFAHTVLVATLAAPDSQTADNLLLPPLYHAELVVIAPLALRLRGMELIGPRAQARLVLQEWLCAYDPEP
jgi:hypothetical protein